MSLPAFHKLHQLNWSPTAVYVAQPRCTTRPFEKQKQPNGFGTCETTQDPTSMANQHNIAVFVTPLHCATVQQPSLHEASHK